MWEVRQTWHVRNELLNPLNAKFKSLNCHPLEIVSRYHGYRDSQLQVGKTYSYFV